MNYFRPDTLGDALEIRAREPVQLLAGGTDVFPMKAGDDAWGKYQPRPILDITALSELRGITRDNDTWRIGALTTWSDVANADLPAFFDGLKLAAHEVGGVQIQNRGTLAGNLCNASPAADGVPPLLALNASIEVTSAKGHRVIALDDFIDGYRHTLLSADEIVTAILIPDLPEETRAHFLKLGARRYLVISIVMASGVIVPDANGQIAQAHIAVGACSEVALRLAALEDALVGQPCDGALGKHLTRTHLDGLAPIDDVRASADYRHETAALNLVRALLEQLGSGARERLV